MMNDYITFLHPAVSVKIAALHSKREDEYFTMSSDDGETTHTHTHTHPW